MQITSQGSDDLGSFVVLIPGACSSCDSPTDIVVKYNSRASVQKNLTALGINPTTSSLVISWRTRQIGVTCGCYARWQRQVAHISKRREGRDTKP